MVTQRESSSLKGWKVRSDFGESEAAGNCRKEFHKEGYTQKRPPKSCIGIPFNLCWFQGHILPNERLQRGAKTEHGFAKWIILKLIQSGEIFELHPVSVESWVLLWGIEFLVEYLSKKKPPSSDSFIG